MITDANQILSVELSGIPDFLKGEPFWANWKPVLVDGKFRKVPTHGMNSLKGNYYDNDGLSFDEAIKTMHYSAGLTFLLSMKHSFACIDIDNCSVDDGRLNKILGLAPDAWCELSPSGHGVHIWGFLPNKPKFLMKGRKSIGYRGKEYEWYGSGRAITVTGRHFSGNSNVDLTAAVNFVESLRPIVVEHIHIVTPVAIGVQSILDKAFEREPELARMYYHGHSWSDESAEDFRFCQRMWFWLGGHGADAIKHVFESSALYRETKGSNYVEITVRNAGSRWNGRYYGNFSR